MPNESYPLGDGQVAWLDDLLGKGAGDPDGSATGEWYILDNGTCIKSEGLQV
jgi:hypothetical protein